MIVVENVLIIKMILLASKNSYVQSNKNIVIRVKNITRKINLFCFVGVIISVWKEISSSL